MHVEITEFPETMVAVVEHFGPAALEHDSARRLVAWKLENRLLDPIRHRSYGVHHTDPRTTPSSEHHVDFCLSVEHEVGENEHGVITRILPATRCARARDVGSRYDNKAAAYLYEVWLPASRECLGSFPAIFHYVNVGPQVSENEMVTDVYLPLKQGVSSVICG